MPPARVAATPTPAPSVSVTVATRGTIVPVRALGGFIAPAQNVLVSSSLSEPANSVRVVEGQRVTKGQVLATFDVTDLEASYQADVHAASLADANAAKQVYAGAQTIGAGESTVANAASTLDQANQKLQLDSLNLNRDAQLLKLSYIAQQAYDAQAQMVAGDRAAVNADRAALESARQTATTNGSQTTGLQGASLTSLREGAAQAHATAQALAAQIARATLVAPIDGVITNRNLNPGEYPGSRVLFTIQVLSTVYAQLNASSGQLAGINVGAPITVVSQSGNTGQEGTVVAVLGAAAPGSTNFTIKAALNNSSGRFLAGMAVSARVTLTPVAGTKVSRNAFVGGTETALGVVHDGAYHAVPVRVLAETATDAIVSGVLPGTPIVAGGGAFADGEKLTAR